jgi:hypothetical protein
MWVGLAANVADFVIDKLGTCSELVSGAVAPETLCWDGTVARLPLWQLLDFMLQPRRIEVLRC